MHGLRLELQATTHFTRRGHRVSWHRASEAGTFDLLVEDLGPSGLEVECKSISENKGRRVHRPDALEFWGSLWKDVAGAAQSLRSGLAVVLTVPYRLPDDAAERVGLADSAPRQFTGTRGGLFWVALQGIDADQLLSLLKEMWRCHFP